MRAQVLCTAAVECPPLWPFGRSGLGASRVVHPQQALDLLEYSPGPFYLCTIVKVLCYFCTIENYKSSSAPSKKLFFPSIPFRPLSSLTVSTIQWDHVVSGQDSYLPPLAPPMAPPTPLSVPGAHTSNSLGVTSSCLHLPRLPTHQPFPAILRVAGPRGGFGRLRG